MLLRIFLSLTLFVSAFADIRLAEFEKKVFSQNGEDGVIEKIFSVIGTTNKYYVEFGVEDGRECNTRHLREFKGWTGLLMDGGFANSNINLHQEFITVENIQGLFEKYSVPQEFDLLSIDIDYNDFYVWRSLASKYKPRVVVIEYNASHLPTEDRIVVYDPKGRWDGTNYFGASLLALFRLGRVLGYSLVYADARGVNLFFIRDDILQMQSEVFENTNELRHIYRYPKYNIGPNGGHPQDPQNRPFTSSEVELKR